LVTIRYECRYAGIILSSAGIRGTPILALFIISFVATAVAISFSWKGYREDKQRQLISTKVKQAKNKLKEMNLFFWGLIFSALISIAVAIWSEYLIRFFDMLPHLEPFRTYITVFGGLVFILFLLWRLLRLAKKQY